MVAEVLSGQPTDPLSSDKLGFLKLFDWRFAHQLRVEECIGPWTDDAQAESTKFITSSGLDDFQLCLREDNTFKEETKLHWDKGEYEAFLAG